MAIWLIVLSVIMFVLQAIDNVYLMSMLSLSQQYADGEVSAGPGFESLAMMIRVTRRWIHYSELFAIDFWIMMFQLILIRFGLVPRLLAAFGLLTMVLHFCSIPLPGFLGYGINTTLGVPMALGLLAVAGWLMVKGFSDETQDENYELGSVGRLK
jgi:hypothetical protein